MNGGTSDTGVLQRIDIDSHAEGVSRQGFGSSDSAVVETRGVVSPRGGLFWGNIPMIIFLLIFILSLFQTIIPNGTQSFLSSVVLF